MSDTIYHIKIKKEYASTILEDLQQIEAIEIIEGEIPKWQQKESLRRLNELKSGIATGISEEDFFIQAEKDEKGI